MKQLIVILVFVANISFGQTSFKTGINFPYYLPDFKSINEYLLLVHDCGANSIRQMTWGDVHWKHVESTDNDWNWDRSDSSFFNPFNITPVGTLYSIMGNDNVGLQTPWLACTNPFNCYWDPAGDSIYSKDYVFRTVNRYKNVTKFWEVANEIESSLPPSGLVNNIAKKDFLRYNYNWIKQADPQAKILLPGLVGTCCTYPISNSFNWLRSMLSLGAGQYFDIMNYHDYNAWWTLPAHYDSVRNILNQYNLTRPIWVTETGISSANVSPITPGYSSPDEQAADVWRRICLLWGKGAEVVMWHANWSSNEMNEWGEFGLVSNGGTKKKSWHSFKLLNEKISDFSTVSIVSLGTVSENNNSGGSGLWVIHFVVNGKNKWVIWSPNNQVYTLSGINSHAIQVTQVVPSILLNNGDSAVFTKNIQYLTGNSYYFNHLTGLPILVEEIITTDLMDNHFSTHPFEFFVYPNPANDVITLQAPTSLADATIVLTNILGLDIISISNFSGEFIKIPLNSLPAGTYFLTVTMQDLALTKKIILRHIH